MKGTNEKLDETRENYDRLRNTRTTDSKPI